MSERCRCYVIDDEPLAVRLLLRHLRTFEDLEVVGTSHDPLEAQSQLDTLEIDLLFLDIEMPQLDGLRLLDSLTTRPQVIITTAYRHYAVEGFDQNVLDYLVKPIALARLSKSIARYWDQAANVEAMPDDPIIYVKADRMNHRLPISQILFVEGLKDYVSVYTSSRRIITKGSIGNFLPRLPSDRFMRVHKSYIVSLQYVQGCTSRYVQIAGRQLPIGRTYREQVLRFLENA